MVTTGRGTQLTGQERDGVEPLLAQDGALAVHLPFQTTTLDAILEAINRVEQQLSLITGVSFAPAEGG